MSGLPEPMAPIVPDLHASSQASLFHAQRAQPPHQNMKSSEAGAGKSGAAAGCSRAVLPNQAEPTAAQAPNRQTAAAPVDVEMKETSRPSVTVPSLEDVNSALSGIELAKQLPKDPQEIHKRFQALLTRNPPNADVLKSIDDNALQMNLPPPLIRPRTPERRAPLKYTLSAYSSHAPPSATRTVPQYKQTILDHPGSGTNIKRYIRMGKPSNPQFTYQPPSRPTSRATSQVPRSRSPPVNRATTGDANAADGAADDHQTVRKRCGCCMQDWDFRTGMSKLRYCPRCEKMRWQLRQNGGGRVQHLRESIGELGKNATISEVVNLALKKARGQAAGDLSTVPAAQPMTLGQGPTIGSLTGDEGDIEPVAGRGSASPREAAAPPLNTMPSTEDIDNMAALLAGKPTDGDEEQPPQKKAAVVTQKDCDLCHELFVWKAESSTSCCENCETLKARTKSAGYTTSELRKGIATGFIFPHSQPSTEEIRRLLGNMMLGRPREAAQDATKSRSGRKAARDRSASAPDAKPAAVPAAGEQLPLQAAAANVGEPSGGQASGSAQPAAGVTMPSAGRPAEVFGHGVTMKAEAPAPNTGLKDTQIAGRDVPDTGRPADTQEPPTLVE